MPQKLRQATAFVLLALCLIFQIHNLVAGVKNKLPVKEVKGKILKREKFVTCGLYKAELLLNNKLVDSKFVDDEMPFSFIISGQKDYVVRITKSGYTTKCVKVNSGIPQYIRSKGYFIYDCVIEIEKETLAMEIR